MECNNLNSNGAIQNTTHEAEPQGDLPQSLPVNGNVAASQQRTAGEPAEEPVNRGDQRSLRPNQNRTRQRRLRQAMLTHESRGSQTTPNYPKYFSIKFLGTDLEKANPIAIERSLLSEAGRFSASVRRQNRNTLLVQASSQQQASKLPNIKRIATYEVAITAHSTLNQSKGTVFSETLSACSIDELEEVLREQSATKVERMKRRVNGALVDTHRHIITFSKPEPPQTIRITDWHYELVDLYIPTPMQCVKCQKLGHTQNHCRRGTPVCARCSQEGHQARDCRNDPKCANCDGDHKSMDKKCPHYEYKAEVLATQTRQRCTYHEAVDQVQDRFRSEGRRFNFMARRQNQRRPISATPDNSNRSRVAPQRAGTTRPVPNQAVEDNNSQGALPPTGSTERSSDPEPSLPPPPSVAKLANRENKGGEPSDGVKPKVKKKKTEKKSKIRSSSVVDYSSDSSQMSYGENSTPESEKCKKKFLPARRGRSGNPQTSQPQISLRNTFSVLHSDDEADRSDASNSRAKRPLSPEADATKKPAKVQQLSDSPGKPVESPETRAPAATGDGATAAAPVVEKPLVALPAPSTPQTPDAAVSPNKATNGSLKSKQDQKPASAAEKPLTVPPAPSTLQTPSAAAGPNKAINDTLNRTQDQEQAEAAAFPYKATLIGSLAAKKKETGTSKIPTILSTGKNEVNRGRGRGSPVDKEGGRGRGHGPPDYDGRGRGRGRGLPRHNR